MKTTSMRVTDLRRTTVSLRAIVIAASFLVPIRGQEFFESFEPPLDFLYCYVSAGSVLGPANASPDRLRRLAGDALSNPPSASSDVPPWTRAVSYTHLTLPTIY